MSIRAIKEDWENVKLRYEAWWRQEIHDRPMVCVTAPRENVQPVPLEQVDPRTQWTDIGHMIRRTLAQVQSTYYGGEAIPVFQHYWSAGHALYFGCEPHFAPDTVWVDPAPVGEDGYPDFDGWRASPWWDWMRGNTLAAAQASQGSYFVMPMWGNHAGDNLALARGTEALLMDLVLNPDWVKWAIKRVSDIQIEVFEELWRLVAPEIVGIEGAVNYNCNWSPGRTHGFDCDMSCMISPKDFTEIFLPPLIETMRTVDHVKYHLDGPGAIKHLDALLEVPEINAIDWVFGAGAEGALSWLPLYRRIQAKGKSITVSASPEEIEPLMRELQPEGLCFVTSSSSEAEARELVAWVGKMHRR